MDRQVMRGRIRNLIVKLEVQREAELLRATTVYGGGAAQSCLVLVWLDEQISKAKRVFDRIPQMCCGCGHNTPEMFSDRCLSCILEP